jgi:hypothetical protein
LSSFFFRYSSPKVLAMVLWCLRVCRSTRSYFTSFSTFSKPPKEARSRTCNLVTFIVFIIILKLLMVAVMRLSYVESLLCRYELLLLFASTFEYL